MTATLTLVEVTEPPPAPPVDVRAAAPVGSPSRPPRRRHWRSHAVMIPVALFSCFPVYWMIVTSLRQSGHEYDQTLFAWPPSLASYQYVFDVLPVGRLLLNTLGFAVAVTIGQLFTSLLAAYAFARWEFVGKNVIFALFLATWLVPFQVTMIPNYLFLSQRGWLDTLTGIIVPQLAGAYGVLMMRQHLKGFPTELLDAARLDGKGAWSTLWRVIVPNMQAPLVALSLLLFVTAWNDYLWPLLVFHKADTVMQVGVQGLIQAEGANNWGAVMAASVLACLPLLIMFVVLQRRLIDAFVRSGIK